MDYELIIFISVEPDSRVIRECGSNNTGIHTECYNRHGVSAHQSVCECDISYCNGAQYLRKSGGGLLLITYLVLYLLKEFSA